MMKDDLQLPTNGRQTIQSVTKTSKPRKQIRRRSRKINISSIPTPEDTKSAKETDQYTSDIEKMKRSTDIKQVMHIPAKERGLPEVSS